MPARNPISSRVLAPLRWILESVGSTLLALGVFVGVLWLTGLAEGSAWRTALYLTPLVAFVLFLALGRRAAD